MITLHCGNHWIGLVLSYLLLTIDKPQYFVLLVSYRWILLPLPVETDCQFSETPYHRYGHTAVSWDDCAYIFGGRNDKNGACNKLFCFDPCKHITYSKDLNSFITVSCS